MSTVGQGVLESGVFRQSFMEEAMEGSVCQVGLLFPCGTCLAGVFLSIKLTHGLTPKHRSGEGGEGGGGEGSRSQEAMRNNLSSCYSKASTLVPCSMTYVTFLVEGSF